MSSRYLMRFSDEGVARPAPVEFDWPLPDMVMLASGPAGQICRPLTESDRGTTGWAPGIKVYRKINESKLGPEVDASRHIMRGAEYQLLTELEVYQWRFPMIVWNEPINVVLTDGEEGGYFCRICIAKHGLKAEQVIEQAVSKEEAEQHIREEHS